MPSPRTTLSPVKRPGLIIDSRYTQTYPRFLERDGFWHWDEELAENVRLRARREAPTKAQA